MVNVNALALCPLVVESILSPQTGAGPANCTLCAAGTYSTAAAAFCTTCVAGNFAPTGEGVDCSSALNRVL